MDSDEADGSEEPSDLSPAAAFALVGHEHRVAILRALLAESREGEYPASFATLRERAGIDVSAQFSYHLDELTGHFVRRTDDGYELRYAGWETATSILAGTYNERAEFGRTDIEGDCPLCEASDLRASYREEWFSIRCVACDRCLIRYPLPPGTMEDRSLDEVLSAFDRYVRVEMELARDGVCPGCFGVMDIRTDATGGDGGFPNGRVAIYDCQRCGNRLYPPLGLFLLGDGRVRQFLRKHGRPPSETPFWAFDFCVSDDAVTVAGTDPWQARLEVTADGETLVVTADEELQVTSATVEEGD